MGDTPDPNAPSGGFAATHTLELTHPAVVGPTTEDLHNTFRPPLFPVACWHLYDLRFEFDSSLIKADVKKEMAQLADLRKEHPDSPITIFGHADPVGSLDYNKELSGRRARCIYALLTRDDKMWEDIYSHPHSQGGDVWGSSATRKMQAALARPAANVTTAAQRSELFLAYMDLICGDLKLTKSDFLARGADPNGKGDYQGCGEYNPLRIFSKAETQFFSASSNHTQRNKENAPNRRVVIYLFRPKAQVSASKWPCPTTREGIAGCIKRLWSDSDKRLAPQAKRREFNETKDTFGCRFYDRITTASPCESVVEPVVIANITLRWQPEKAVCGDKVKLVGDTNLADGTLVKVELKPKGGGHPPALAPLDLTVTDGKIQQEIEIKDFAFDSGSSFVDFIEVDATVPDKTVRSNTATLHIDALLDAPVDTFKANRSWSGFTMKPEFTQKIDKFKCSVGVSFKVMKMWGGYYVDLTSAGVTGTAGGCPWAGFRWARENGTAHAEAPNQYYDGHHWVAFPAGFSLTGLNHSAICFFKKGGQFVSRSGGTWPEAFADYDFNSADNVKVRENWIKDTHDRWTDKFEIRRKGCKSAVKARCCRYTVEVTLSFTEVNTDGDGVVALAPGDLRSNASNWFMGDPDVKTAAHESGHHLDNPDEYAGGAVDPSLNGDGATNGIDPNSIMGQAMTPVKKRHLHAVAEMVGSLIKKKYGRDYKYEVVDK